MRLHTKALYNLLRYNYLEDPSLYCDKWQIEDLRDLAIDKLFSRLNALGVSVDKEQFSLYAEDCDGPEDLTECLVVDKQSSQDHDKIYLVIFELWRRVLPEKLSMSVFCDELDHRIYLYDKSKLETDELIQDGVANLIDILDENIDAGKDPKEVFISISRYCAHDLESFLYDYIADQIDDDNDIYAGDLLENFSQFLSNWQWFDFLQVRIVAKTDVIIANDIIKKIVDDEKEHPDVDLALEILQFMVQIGDLDLFIRLAKMTLNTLRLEAEFIELLETIAEFFQRLDMEEKDEVIQKIIDQRKNIDEDTPLDISDRDIKTVKSALKVS